MKLKEYEVITEHLVRQRFKTLVLAESEEDAKKEMEENYDRFEYYHLDEVTEQRKVESVKETDGWNFNN